MLSARIFSFYIQSNLSFRDCFGGKDRSSQKVYVVSPKQSQKSGGIVLNQFQTFLFVFKMGRDFWEWFRGKDRSRFLGLFHTGYLETTNLTDNNKCS